MSDTTTPTAIEFQPGQMVEGRGIDLAPWVPNRGGVGVYAYSAPDFLRDESGRQLILNFIEGGQELARRNGGRTYGTEAELRKAIVDGTYQDGDLAFVPRELIDGKNAEGERVRPYNNIFVLLGTSPAFKKIRDTAQDASANDRWVMSGSEHPRTSSHVCHVRLTDGIYSWYDKDVFRSGVVPVRFFRTAPAPGG